MLSVTLSLALQQSFRSRLMRTVKQKKGGVSDVRDDVHNGFEEFRERHAQLKLLNASCFIKVHSCIPEHNLALNQSVSYSLHLCICIISQHADLSTSAVGAVPLQTLMRRGCERSCCPISPHRPRLLFLSLTVSSSRFLSVAFPPAAKF